RRRCNDNEQHRSERTYTGEGEQSCTGTNGQSLYARNARRHICWSTIDRGYGYPARSATNAPVQRNRCNAASGHLRASLVWGKNVSAVSLIFNGFVFWSQVAVTFNQPQEGMSTRCAWAGRYFSVRLFSASSDSHFSTSLTSAMNSSLLNGLGKV